MALQLNVQNQFSASGTIPIYFKLIETNFNYANMVGRIVFGGYFDKDSANLSRPLFSAIAFDLDSSGMGGITKNVFSGSGATPIDCIKNECYNFAKQQPEFANAVDM